jgi:WD40 repeat protein
MPALAFRSTRRRSKGGVPFDLEQTHSSCQCSQMGPKGCDSSTLLDVYVLTITGEILASAGDDGNVVLWTPDESHHPLQTFGDDNLEDKESWRVKHMCRSSGEGIYDLAWSPDSIYFIIGSMDNIARIYNAQSGKHQPFLIGIADLLI